MNIQSVAIRSTRNVYPVEGTGVIKTAYKKEITDKNLITTKAIEFKHTQFKCEVNNKLLNVICPNYQPEIIFSASINDYWKPMKVATTERDNLDDLDIYWDYLYEGMEIQGTIRDNVFIINIPSLKKNCQKLRREYVRERLLEAKDNKLSR